MLFKLDENLPSEAASLLREFGHDAATVHEQGLAGYPDELVASVCKSESRAIITMDLDFADIRNFPPEEYSGIIVFRIEDQGRASFMRNLLRIMPALKPEDLAGNLWVVDEDQIRVRP